MNELTVTTKHKQFAILALIYIDSMICNCKDARTATDSYNKPAMEFSSAIYGAIAFFLFLYSYLRCSTYLKPKHKLPPQASGARLILGHLHLLHGSSVGPAHINLAAVADRHGPIFTIRLGMQRAVVVSSWKIAKELFTTHDVAVSSRVRTRAIKHLSYDFAMFGFSPYGPYWRELRKLVTTEFLSSSQIQRLSHVSISEILVSIRELYTLWEEKKDDLGRVSVDMKKWFRDLNMNTILMMVVGKRFGSNSEDDNTEEMQQCRKVIKDFFDLAGLFVVADALPWLGWLDLGGYEKRMKETTKEFDIILERWLVEHRRQREDSQEKAQDFMDVMVSMVRGSDQFNGLYDADTIIKSTCKSLILGGSDTSSVMLTWTISLLLNNRHVLIKAQEELDKHVGRERRVNESDIHNLVYLQAIIKESQRLYPPGPLAITRELDQDCNMEGYQIPTGTLLIVNLWKLQRDPEVWSNDSFQFKPERFLTTHRDVDVRGQHFELIPFGACRRSCPGANLALHIIHLVLANFLQAFEVAAVCDETVDMTEGAGLTNEKATPLVVVLTPKLPTSLY